VPVVVTRERSAWLSGVAVGAAGGFAALELPTVGWVVILAFAVPALVVGPRIAAIGGLLTGIGMTWALLFGRMALACQATGEESGCDAPDLTPWLASTGAMIGIGLALTAVAAWRSRTRRSDRASP
jgi:hypothetical protein